MLRRRKKAPSLAARGGFEHFQRVRLRGLKARPELNGLEGVVIEWVEDEARWNVRLDDGTGKEIKPANLELAPEGRAISADVREGLLSVLLPEPTASTPPSDQKLEPVQLHPGLDLEAWCAPTHTAAASPVLLPSALQAVDTSRDVPPSSALAPVAFEGQAGFGRPEIALGSGARVRVHDLKGAAYLNGMEGVLLEKDLSDNDGRWRVTLDDGFSKSIREINLYALVAPPFVKDDSKGGSSAFTTGCRVRVIGLQARPELNKQEGDLVDWDDEEGRWKVCLESGPQLLLREVNLQPVAAEGKPEPSAGGRIVPGARVRVFALHTATHLNGEEGTVLLWVEDEKRWKVRLDDGSGKMLQDANLLLLSVPPPGSQLFQVAQDVPDATLAIGFRVKVHGLQTREDLNDMQGDIVGWDEAESRWRVELADGTCVMLKSDNVVPAGGKSSNCPIS